MTDEQLARSAEFYGISMDEARQRVAKCEAQGDNPANPICIGCAKHPHELASIVELADNEGISPATYIIDNEGTFNSGNGHFLCDLCYIRNGMPSTAHGWVCP